MAVKNRLRKDMIVCDGHSFVRPYRKPGLTQLLIEVTMNRVLSASINMLWHGNPTDKFLPARGVKQGDPSSP